MDTRHYTDLRIKVESSTSADDMYNMPIKRIKNETGMENSKLSEMTLDTKTHIKVEKDVLGVDVNTEYEQAEKCMDNSKHQMLTEALYIKPEYDISDDENCAELDRAVEMKLASKEHGVVNTKADKGSFICYHCNSIFHSKNDLVYHISVENCSLKSNVEETLIGCESLNHSNEYICIKCDKIFKVSSVDNHVIRHDEASIGSVPSGIHQCKHNFQTTKSQNTAGHMTKESESRSSVNQILCIHCNKKFTNKTTLDNHIIKNHKEFIRSVTSKIHQCKHCSFQTTFSSSLTRHLMNHPEGGFNVKRFPCIHCDIKFKKKTALDDHLIKKHKDFVTSVSSKIHQCEHCSYTTTMSSRLAVHKRKHIENMHTVKRFPCIHCPYRNEYKSKRALDDHVIKNHEDFIASVSHKIHQCKHCSYRTASSSILALHMEKHPENGCTVKQFPCIHCDMTFKSKTVLDNHIIQNHEEFIGSVTFKIYQCTHCNYKTKFSSHLSRHMTKHECSFE